MNYRDAFPSMFRRIRKLWPLRVGAGHILAVLGIAISIGIYSYDKCESGRQRIAFVNSQIDRLKGDTSALDQSIELRSLENKSLSRLLTDLEQYIDEQALREEVESIHGAITEALESFGGTSGAPMHVDQHQRWMEAMRVAGANPFAPVPQSLRLAGLSDLTRLMQMGDLVPDPENAVVLQVKLRKWLTDREDLGDVNNYLERRLAEVDLYHIRNRPPPGPQAASIIREALNVHTSKLSELTERVAAQKVELVRYENEISFVQLPSYCLGSI